MKYVSLSRLIGRIARSNLQELPLPYRLTFAVTNRCQARCTMCNIWQKPVDDELTVAEIDRLFTKANRFSWINLTGGELFQRPDIFNILLTVVRRSRDLYLLNFPTNGIQTSTII
jgi:MoaA/NifB/PqqE/SkfB family radical SAM enzyme